MSAVSLLVAGALTAVGIPEGYVDALANRFPAWAAANNRNVYVLLDIATRPDGTIMACRTVEWDGSKKFADQACALIWHIILEPARDAEGKAAYGRRKMDFKFMTSGLERSDVNAIERSPDYVIPVQGFSSAEDGPPRYAVNVLVDTDGRIGQCDTAKAELGDDPSVVVSPSDHDEICRQLRTKKRFVLQDSRKNAVSYVESLLVHLKAAS